MLFSICKFCTTNIIHYGAILLICIMYKLTNSINFLIKMIIFIRNNFLIKMMTFIRNNFLGFPGGAVVENLPASAGDTGSSPGLGRSHMPRSN